MPSRRGLAVFGVGLGLWLSARMVGSPDLHIAAVGVCALPFVAALFTRWSRQHLSVARRLSATRVAPGERLTVDLEVENGSSAPTSFLLLEDRLPAALGPPGRLVLMGLPAHASQRVSYTLTCRSRGRYRLGPVTLHVADPFALTSVRVELPVHDDLVVHPEVEPLSGAFGSGPGSSGGQSAARRLHTTGEDFYTMREYQIGDDLRRIHWPSVARRGVLMIRQDESARRSLATVFLDTRAAALGQAGSPPFEKAVSAAASLGVLLSQGGASLRLATVQAGPRPVTEEAFLEALASVTHSPTRSLPSALMPLRSGALADSTLVVVTAPLLPSEIAPLTRVGAVFGPKVAVLVYPVDPQALPPERGKQLEGRAWLARLSLARGGWDVVVLSPAGRLQDLWHQETTQSRRATASSR